MSKAKISLGDIVNRYNHLQNITDEELDVAVSSLTAIADGLEELGVIHSLSVNEVRRLLRAFEQIIDARQEK